MMWGEWWSWLKSGLALILTRGDPATDPYPSILAFLLVAFIGLFVGITELVSRYRDYPFRAIRTAPGFWYIFINLAASLLALLLLWALQPEWLFPQGDFTAGRFVLLVLTAG